MTLADCQVPTKAALWLPSSAGRGENRAKGFWIEIKGDLSPVPIIGKTHSVCEINIIHYQSNQNRLMRNKPKSSEYPLTTPSSFFPGLALFLVLYHLLAGGNREWGHGQFITCCLCHSTPCGGDCIPFCSVGSLPWETVLHGLLQCVFLPRSTILHSPFQQESVSWGAVLQGWAIPAWIPHEVANLPANLFQSGLHSTGPQVLARSLL